MLPCITPMVFLFTLSVSKSTPFGRYIGPKNDMCVTPGLAKRLYGTHT